MNWIECNDWKKLPEGRWLVFTSNKHKPYQVAYATATDQCHKIVIVGGLFSWDASKLIAYTSHDEYSI